MEADVALFLLSEMIRTSTKIASPILFAALAVGLIVSIFQVVTQIQEMTLTFVPKIIAAAMVALAAGGWMLTTLMEFTRQVFLFAAGL